MIPLAAETQRAEISRVVIRTLGKEGYTHAHENESLPPKPAEILNSRTQRIRFTSLYLAGLLIVNDQLDSISPHNVETKEAPCRSLST